MLRSDRSAVLGHRHLLARFVDVGALCAGFGRRGGVPGEDSLDFRTERHCGGVVRFGEDLAVGGSGAEQVEPEETGEREKGR